MFLNLLLQPLMMMMMVMMRLMEMMMMVVVMVMQGISTRTRGTHRTELSIITAATFTADTGQFATTTCTAVTVQFWHIVIIG